MSERLVLTRHGYSMIPTVWQQGIRRALPNALEGAEYNILKRTLPSATDVIIESIERARRSPIPSPPAFRPRIVQKEGASSTFWKGYGYEVRAELIQPKQALRGKWSIE